MKPIKKQLPLYEHDDAIWQLLIGFTVVAVAFVGAGAVFWLVTHWPISLFWWLIVLIVAVLCVVVSQRRRSLLPPEHQHPNE